MTLRSPVARIAFTLLALLAGFVTFVLAGDDTPRPGDNAVRHVTARQSASIIAKNPDIVVLDVRTPREFRRGHVKGAKNVNYFAFSFRKQIARLDSDKTYLVYCAAGYRSTWSLKILKDAGIRNIIHMDGGMNAWKKAKLDTVKK